MIKMFSNKRNVEKAEDRLLPMIKKMMAIGLILCAVVHTSYLVLFSYMEIWSMFLVNIGSVLIYCSLLIALKRDRTAVVLHSVYLEIICQSILATIYTRWDFGFYMFLICLAAMAFYLPFRNKAAPYLYCVGVLVIYVVLRIIMLRYEHELSLLGVSSGFVAGIYLYNSLVSFSLLIFLSWLHNVMQMQNNLELEEKKHQLEILASIDPLTGLYNRRAMKQHLDEMRQNAVHGEIIIAIADIDDFKKINDEYGHDCGDVVLKKIADLLNSLTNEETPVSRWGGEEFLIAIPNMERMEAVHKLEQIRAYIAAEKFMYNDKRLSVTMTFGVSKDQGEKDFDQIIIQADRRLYEGKQSGKNQVVCGTAF